MGLADATWTPMRARVPVLPPNDVQTPPNRRFVAKTQKFEKLQLPLNSRQTAISRFVAHMATAAWT